MKKLGINSEEYNWEQYNIDAFDQIFSVQQDVDIADTLANVTVSMKPVLSPEILEELWEKEGNVDARLAPFLTINDDTERVFINKSHIRFAIMEELKKGQMICTINIVFLFLKIIVS